MVTNIDSLEGDLDIDFAVDSSRLQVLVVDDSATIRASLVRYLEDSRLPLDAHQAKSGTEALEMMRARDYDIVFSDIEMPGLTGPEMLSAIQAEGHKCFAVMMSGASVEKGADLGRSVGAYTYLHKPFSEHDVINCVQAYQRMHQTARVLVVDDSPTVRKLILRIVGASRFKTELDEAGSGEEALTKIGKGSYDIAFIDCNMPGIDGLQTVRRIKLRNSGVRVVMMSSHVEATAVQAAQREGVIAFLKKPFYPADIDAVLHKAFGLDRPVVADKLPTAIVS
ncbi:MAG: response regulator [Hyphomicrobiaceae bacterium]|nr:response regulator [Hyphomicrobiaceae bacterium]